MAMAMAMGTSVAEVGMAMVTLGVQVGARTIRAMPVWPPSPPAMKRRSAWSAPLLTQLRAWMALFVMLRMRFVLSVSPTITVRRRMRPFVIQANA
jgi:hypothetical protein